jgi:hypothetical protein
MRKKIRKGGKEKVNNGASKKKSQIKEGSGT